jgi:hypothetical protein
VKRFVMLVVVLGLSGAVVFLLSQLNARTFTVEARDGKLVVLKGRMMPTGSEPYQPSDPALADAYAPVDLAGTSASGLAERRFIERDELDRALFQVIETLAKPRVTSDDPKLLEAGLYYLRRAEKLTGLTAEQKLSVKSLQAEVAYYQARSKLEDAQRLIGESLSQLRLAAAAQNRNAHSANQMILAVEPPAKALEASLRTAVHGLSAPAAVPVEVPAPVVPAAAAPVPPAAPEEKKPEAPAVPAPAPAPAQ